MAYSIPDAKLVGNQPIRDSLITLSSMCKDPYTKLVFVITATKVANVELDLFLNSKEVHAWLSTLGTKLHNMISEFVEIYSIMHTYNTTGNTDVFFPPEWHGTLKQDDERYSIALDLDVNSFHSNFNTPLETKTRGEALNFYYGDIKYDKTRKWLFEQIETIECGATLMKLKYPIK
jgi:hypothetical protein